MKKLSITIVVLFFNFILEGQTISIAEAYELLKYSSVDSFNNYMPRRKFCKDSIYKENKNGWFYRFSSCESYYQQTNSEGKTLKAPNRVSYGLMQNLCYSINIGTCDSNYFKQMIESLKDYGFDLRPKSLIEKNKIKYVNSTDHYGLQASYDIDKYKSQGLTYVQYYIHFKFTTTKQWIDNK